MNVVSSASLPLPEWLAADRRAAAPTFFARPAWALALADAYPHLIPDELAFRISDGSTAYLPMMRSKLRGLLCRAYSGMPFGSYTLVLDETCGPARPEAADAVIRWLLAMRNSHVALTLWPLAPAAPEIIGVRESAFTTAVVDMGDGLEAALSRMDGNARRMAGQAVRRGVSCAPDRSADATAAYHDMLADASRGWGLDAPPISRALLDAVIARGGDDAEIWFARYEGERIAGGVMLYGSAEAFFWSAAMRADFGTLRPSNALNMEMMGAAARRGVRWYNLGASEGLPGVARFKAGLGATELAYRTITRTTPLYQLFTAAQSAATALRRRRV